MGPHHRRVSSVNTNNINRQCHESKQNSLKYFPYA